MSAGSIATTATFRTASDDSTVPATFTVAGSWTSTDVAVPTTRWFVDRSPFAATTTADAWAVGVQTATTLSCHRGRRNVGSVSGDPVELDDEPTAPTSAFLTVSASTASRPATMSTVCIH